MNRYLTGAAALAVFASPVQAQPSQTVASPAIAAAPDHSAVDAAAAAVTAGTVLPANTEMVLVLNSNLSSEDARLGDKFSLSLAQDVKLGNDVVIPKGTRAVGQVTMRQGKGGFGKSGKMDLDFRYLDYNNLRIPIEGRHHQEGEGNSAATVGAVLAAGVIGGLIVHGKSARISEGHEFTAHLVDSIPLEAPAGAGTPAVIAASYTPSAVNLQVMTDKERKAYEKALKAGKPAPRHKA